jgi:preprotein translocase subunit SecF
MKKIIILTAVSLFVASSAFAAGTAALALSVDTTGLTLYGAKTGTASTASPQIGKTSTGVGIGMKVDNNAGAGYSVETQHKNGTKAYGSAYDSTSIYVKDIVKGTADATSLTTGGDSFAGVTGWTTL